MLTKFALDRTKKSIMALTGKPLKTLKDGIVDGDKTVEDWQKQIDREGECAAKTMQVVQCAVFSHCCRTT